MDDKQALDRYLTQSEPDPWFEVMLGSPKECFMCEKCKSNFGPKIEEYIEHGLVSQDGYCQTMIYRGSSNESVHQGRDTWKCGGLVWKGKIVTMFIGDTMEW